MQSIDYFQFLKVFRSNATTVCATVFSSLKSSACIFQNSCTTLAFLYVI